jgi:hypothetical protein
VRLVAATGMHDIVLSLGVQYVPKGTGGRRHGAGNVGAGVRRGRRAPRRPGCRVRQWRRGVRVPPGPARRRRVERRGRSGRDAVAVGQPLGVVLDDEGRDVDCLARLRRPQPRRLRRPRRRSLAGVRAAREGSDHRPPRPLSRGGAVRRGVVPRASRADPRLGRDGGGPRRDDPRVRTRREQRLPRGDVRIHRGRDRPARLRSRDHGLRAHADRRAARTRRVPRGSPAHGARTSRRDDHLPRRGRAHARPCRHGAYRRAARPHDPP